MIRKFLLAVPIVCFTASVVWADADAKPAQDQPAPAPEAEVEPAEPSDQSQAITMSWTTVTEPISQWGRKRTLGAESAAWDAGLTYDASGIDQTIRWVGAQGNQWSVRIDDVIAAQNMKIATTQDTAMASLSDEQVSDRLGITINSWTSSGY